MPRMFPFRGIRYARDGLDAVSAPPYDVIDEDERAELEAADPHNAVTLILPRGDGDRYAAAGAALEAWIADGTLAVDPAPALYAYRMRYADEHGAPRTTLGVIGALELPSADGHAGVLPHERTLPKARSDRLALLRATRANLDPIWGLSLAPGLGALVATDELPDAGATTAECRHELWVIDDPERITAITGLVETAPIVLADGHHRFENACAYRREHPGDDAAGAVMALVVELAVDQLSVGAIHRIVHGPVPGLRERLAPAFRVEDAGPNEPAGVTALLTRMDAEQALGLVDRHGLALLVPRAGVLDTRLGGQPDALRDVDAARFDVAIRPELGDATLAYRDDATTVAALVGTGAADAAVLLRPVTVDQIRAVAFAGERMPEKTTFFRPKPRTGFVFRSLDR